MNIQEFGRVNEFRRNKWVAEKLQKIPKGLRLLDAGAGEQQYRSFCDHLEYVAQDFGQYDGMGDNSGLHKMAKWDTSKNNIISDITAIPLPSASIDAVLCTEVFEHISQPVLALQEFSRLLASRGHLILTAPFCSLTHQSPYHHYSGFNRYFYEHFLPIFGFDIMEIFPNGNYYEYLAQEIMRIPEISKRYSNMDMANDELQALRMTLQMLYRRSENDNGSSELLAYGFHVYAIKK
jgi:ubiquinone/menaquinone biosynthesis C-methylase UbiE